MFSQLPVDEDGKQVGFDLIAILMWEKLEALVSTLVRFSACGRNPACCRTACMGSSSVCRLWFSRSKGWMATHGTRLT